MSWRFQKRVSIIPGLRLNASKSGLSLSIGHRGAWYTVGRRGRRVTVGVPGTGLYWTESVPPARPPHAGHQIVFALFAAALIALFLYALANFGG